MATRRITAYNDVRNIRGIREGQFTSRVSLVQGLAPRGGMTVTFHPMHTCTSKGSRVRRVKWEHLVCGPAPSPYEGAGPQTLTFTLMHGQIFNHTNNHKSHDNGVCVGVTPRYTTVSGGLTSPATR